MAQAGRKKYMKYTWEYDKANDICIIRVADGEEFHRPEDSYELKRFGIRYHREHGCRRFLVDLTNANVVGSTMQAYDAANLQGELAEGHIGLKAAFVRRELSKDDHFYENVSLNRGFQVRAMDSIEKAIKWLKQNE